MSAHDAERAAENAERSAMKRAAKEAKRQRALRLWADGDLTKTAIAERLGIDTTTVSNWIREVANGSH